MTVREVLTSAKPAKKASGKDGDKKGAATLFQRMRRGGKL